MIYLSIRGDGPQRRAEICNSWTGAEATVTRQEAEDLLVTLARFLVGPDSRLPFQIRAMVRRAQTNAIKKGTP